MKSADFWARAAAFVVAKERWENRPSEKRIDPFGKMLRLLDEFCCIEGFHGIRETVKIQDPRWRGLLTDGDRIDGRVLGKQAPPHSELAFRHGKQSLGDQLLNSSGSLVR